MSKKEEISIAKNQTAGSAEKAPAGKHPAGAKNRSAVKKAGKKLPHAKPPGKGGFFSGVKRDAPQTAQQTIPLPGDL